MSRPPARRSTLAAATALSVALTTGVLATSATAAPPGPPSPADHRIDPSRVDRTLAEARKAVGITGATGQITALVTLDTPAGVDVAAQGKDAVQDAAAQTEAVAEAVVPTELTTKNARSATPKRVGTLTNLVAGTLVSGDAAKIRALASKDEVTAIYRVMEKRPTNSSTVAFTKALQAWQDTGQTGAGISLAVIDTGLDYTHASFGGAGTVEAYEEAYGEDGTQPVDPAWFDAAKFAGGYDFAGPLYDASLDEPGSTDVPTPDENPIDALSTSSNSGHGTHVAGTAAGYGVDATGATFRGDYTSLTDVSDWEVGPGSAPGALLWSFKVFGDIGGSTDLTSLALDRAADPNGDGDLSDRVDVVNMSLGGDGAPADDPDSLLVTELTKLGVLVTNSAGNAGDITDIGGAPGNSPSALTVANSVATPALDAVKVTAASDDALEGDLLPAQNSVAYGGPDVEAPVAYVGATFDGCTAFTAAQAAAVAGKIAYLWWDDDDTSRRCGSAARFNNATAAGAVGVVLPTELTVFSAGIAGNATIPGAQLTKQSTDTLLPEIQAGTLTLEIGPGLALSSRLDGAQDLLNDGSSRGVHGSLGVVKPDVAAPGTGILSAASGGGTAGHVLSGTSMAAPHVAGIAALVRAAHPRWSPTEVKAAIVNTATHDVTTEPDGGGLAYGPERVGAGRVDALAAVETDVVAYNAKNPALTSVTFGVVDVGPTKVTRTATVTVRNFGRTTQSYDASFAAASTTGGATVSVSPKRVTVPRGGKATVTLTLSVDPATLERDIDPTSSLEQGGLPREYVAALTGRLVLDSRSGDDELRVPVQAAPRIVSDLKAKDVTFTGSADTAGLALRGRGVASGGWQSLTTPLILGATSPRLPNEATLGTSRSAVRSGDLRYVGWSSTAPYVEALGADPQDDGLLNVGIATEGNWASLGLAVYPVIDIDVDGDGTFDLESIVWKLDEAIDLTVVTTYDLNAPASAPAVDIEPINYEFGDVDTGVFDSNVLVAPISLGATGIAPGDTPTISVWTYSPYGGDDSVVDEADVFTTDPYDPPFWFENDRASLVSTDGADGVSIPVHRSADATSGDLLVFQHHNRDGKRVQVVDVTVPTSTTTTLAVSGGTSYGSKARLTATVAPATARGSVAFRDGTKLLAVQKVHRGKATASVALGIGEHSLTASFVPDRGSSYLASTSAPVSLTVGKSATTTSVKVDGFGGASRSATLPSGGKGGPSGPGGPLTAVVTVVGATAAPSGTVTLSEGGTKLGTAKLSARGLTGTAKVTVRDLAPGKHTLTATYPGSATTEASTGAVTVTVRR
ncbi:S8 family serine peptidase [Cellulomonas palmilytica]|uniref:S8 family serine peptidase n=1 Tax=Cellulomonas palmilytica TaxID=2608402 RepID=UPI001F236EC4|nr:S8 family serine peptidase [Cellulomonas palmilytica]UJP40881.1 S8 family serine peptidase [Cellulomonas palmilytica]